MAILDSIKKFVFPAVDENDEITETREVKSTARPVREETSGGVKRSKVVSFPTGADNKIVVIKLDSTAGVKTILDNLKSKTPVIFNIARLDRTEASRCVDIVYGASYALDGSMQKVSNDIFIVTPSGMEIAGDITQQLLGAEEFSLDL